MPNSRFRKFVWGVLIYTILVILWGAIVRATGSGAGCGNHWPTCNGTAISRPESVETLIELSHRLSSALSGLLVLFMLVWARRSFPKKHLVRRGAAVSFFFILMEGLIGALLVRFELVGSNASLARAGMIGLHLVNTFFLLAAITLTGWWSRKQSPLRWNRHRQTAWLIIIGTLGFMVLGGSGAITALGDTLFPAESLIDGFQEDFSAGANFLIRLRVYHPLIGIGLGLYLLYASTIIKSNFERPAIRRFTLWIRWLFGLEIGVGILNVLLLAPIWMQLIHLLLADLVWITAVLLAVESLTTTASHPANVTIPPLKTGQIGA